MHKTLLLRLLSLDAREFHVILSMCIAYTSLEAVSKVLFTPPEEVSLWAQDIKTPPELIQGAIYYGLLDLFRYP